MRMKKLKFSQRVEVVDRLRDYLVKRDDGLYMYKEPWSDRIIGEKYGVNASVIAAMRNEVFGNLYAIKGGGNQSGTKIVALVQEIDKLAARVEELWNKVDKLVVTLAANHIADVKHLRPTNVQHNSQQPQRQLGV